ncbi:hypothetical protein IFR05_000665 [Cadophora sp. M221]|nr:hypothetical protein IFR05_000665 [Cadophora sp. M221]
MAPYAPSTLPLTEMPAAGSTASQQAGAFEHRIASLASQHSNRSSHSTFSLSAHNGIISKGDHILPSPPGGRRQRAGGTPTTSSTSKSDPLNRMGVFYSKILTYSTGTRYSIYIVLVAILLAIPIIVGATQVSVTSPKIGGIRVVWFFNWFEVVWLSFWAMKFVARVLPKVFGFFAGVVSSKTKKYARVLENLEGMITVFGWVMVSFVAYEVLFSTASAGNTPLGWTTKFKQVLGAVLVSTIIFFIEKILVQLISVSYHARSFNNRIDASKNAVHLLGILFDASRSLFPMYGGEFLEEDFIIHANIEAFVKKGRKDRISQEAKPEGRGR